MSGAKWLAVGALGLLALVALLLYEMEATPAAAKPTVAAAPVVAARVAAPPPRAAQAARAIAKVAEATDQPKKLDPASDEFFNRFTDVVPVVLTRSAMRKCYKGGLHRRGRNESITLEFTDHIVNGEVTVTNVHPRMSNLNDPELESCFIAAVSAAHWHDDSLPDIDQQDEITINPERGGKKYLDEDLDYTGADAPPNTPR